MFFSGAQGIPCGLIALRLTVSGAQGAVMGPKLAVMGPDLAVMGPDLAVLGLKLAMALALGYDGATKFGNEVGYDSAQ